MARIHGGEMLVRALEREGVRELFTLHGGHLDPILLAAARHNFHIVDARHEQAAAHMAEGWARVTGRPGVAAVTAGPGVTDAVTGVANAFVDSIPMILLGGRSPLMDDELMPLQGGFDQVDLMRPVTKWARTITRVERIPEYIAMAFRHATSGRPGPVFLELPVDVLFAREEEDKIWFPQESRPKAPPGPSKEGLAQAMRWLSEAERPAILAGGGVWFAQAGAELTRFAELTHTPVMVNPKARGSISDDHPLCFGGFGAIAPGSHARMKAPSADLVIMLGTRFGWLTGGRRSVVPADAKVIQVDIESEEIGRSRNIELGIVSDCGEFLRQAIAAAQAHKFGAHPEWLERLGSIRERHAHRWDEELKREDGAIHPARLMRDITATLDPGAMLVADGGETSNWMNAAWKSRHPGRFVTHGYMGTLGTGMPFAIAAKAAFPDRQVVCVIGDGSVGLNFSEFHTAVKNNLPIVVVVNNDQQWGMSKHTQELAWGKGRDIATSLGKVHYEQAAAGLGAHAEFVEQVGDIVPALKRALASGRTACVNVLTDPEIIEPATLAMYSGFGGAPKDGAKPAADGKAEAEKKDDGVMIPYYGKRKID